MVVIDALLTSSGICIKKDEGEKMNKNEQRPKGDVDMCLKHEKEKTDNTEWLSLFSPHR